MIRRTAITTGTLVVAIGVTALLATPAALASSELHGSPAALKARGTALVSAIHGAPDAIKAQQTAPFRLAWGAEDIPRSGAPGRVEMHAADSRLPVGAMTGTLALMAVSALTAGLILSRRRRHPATGA